jgi:hypothetical protein
MHPNVAPTSVPPLDSASRSMRLSHRGSNKLSRRTSPAPSGFRSVKHGVPLGPSARSAADAVNAGFAVKPYDTRARSPRRMPCTHAEARAALVDNTSSRSSSRTSALRPRPPTPRTSTMRPGLPRPTRGCRRQSRPRASRLLRRMSSRVRMRWCRARGDRAGLRAARVSLCPRRAPR